MIKSDHTKRKIISKMITLMGFYCYDKISYFIWSQIEPGVKDDFQPRLMKFFRRFDGNKNVIQT